MKAPTLNYEELQRAAKIYNEVSFQGFVLNVANSFREGVINQEEVNNLLSTKET